MKLMGTKSRRASRPWSGLERHDDLAETARDVQRRLERTLTGLEIELVFRAIRVGLSNIQIAQLMEKSDAYTRTANRTMLGP